MNHKLLQMLNEAGFDFTPDIMAKLPEFEKLIWLEREACAEIAFNAKTYIEAANAIRARGRG